MIEYIIRKIKKSKLISDIYLCTSDSDEDRVLEEIAKANNIGFFAGYPDSPIERIRAVAKISNADNIIRITGDNIFTDEVYLDLMLKHHDINSADYTRTEYLPIGITPEILKTEALNRAYSAMPIQYSEYLMLYMFQPIDYNCLVLVPPKQHQKPNWNLSVDTVNDWQRTTEIISNNVKLLNIDEIIKLVDKKQISFLEYEMDGIIKLPGGLKMSFKSIRTELDLRLSKSRIVKIIINDYHAIQNEQNNSNNC